MMAKKFYNQKVRSPENKLESQLQYYMNPEFFPLQMAHEQQLRKLKQMARDGGINVNRGIKLVTWLHF